ncbi:MAG TPA: oligoendopeptidase F [Chloroflexia bacterium]|nr:oligoendopeptidase F [Chloroflexia bacterium]
MAKTLPKRSDIPVNMTWDLQSVFPSDAAWEAAYQEVAAQVPDLGRFQGTLGQSGARLLEALTARDAFLKKVYRLYLYASMQMAGDSAEQAYTVRGEQAGGLEARAGAAAAYMEPEILALGAERLAALVAEEPGLAVYQHYLDVLNRRRAHIRSAEVEDLLAQAGDVTASPYRIHMALEDADLKFGTIRDENQAEVEIQQGNVWPLIRSNDAAVRQAAWETYADGYLSVKNTMAATLVGGMKRDVFYARARNYPTSLEAALDADHIPAVVFHNLIETFQRYLPVWHRFWDVRRRALGLDRMHLYDMYVPLIRSERPIPYEQSIETICTGMAPLGEEYVNTMRRGLQEQRWVDVYPNQGKGSGAFSSGVPGTHPFLMLNYDDSLQTLSTLAHELGHSMHSYFTWQTQPPVYGQYSMFVAETASNFNQALTRAHLLETEQDPDFQLEILSESLANFHRYFFIMPTLARFELECHSRLERGEGLSADSMSEIMLGYLREGFGPEVEIDEPRAGILWAQFTHLFANFYVYQYATGISAAAALSDGVRREGAPAAERYLNFLRAGNSLYSIDALKVAGVDMTQPEPVERAFEQLSALVDQLDKLVGEGPLRPAG